MSKSNWREEHDREVDGEGYYPLDPKYIDEFITRKARSSPEWATAYALLELGKSIHGGLSMIAGTVDDCTGIMRIGGCLEAMVKLKKKELEKEGKERGNA